MKSSEMCCRFVMATDDNELKQNNKAKLAARSWGFHVYLRCFFRHFSNHAVVWMICRYKFLVFQERCSYKIIKYPQV